MNGFYGHNSHQKAAFLPIPIVYLCAHILVRMQKIHPKTLQDLEFPTVLQQVSTRCNTELGKEMALAITPIAKKEDLLEVLGQTSEYLASYSNDNRIPQPWI